MNKIPKKIHYIWFWRWEKPESLKRYLKTWTKYCPDYKIIEWNENNYDINKNKYLKTFYNKKKWAFAADYARFDILYNHWWIYFDTDVEIFKNFDNLLDNKLFLWFQDIFSLWGAVIWAEKKHPIIKEILDFYEKKRIRIILPNLLNKIFKKYSIKSYSKNIIKKEDFTIYPKEYFYPYAYFEKKEDMVIRENTYTIHHYDATWLPNVITKYIFPVIWYITKIYKKY